MKKKRPLSVTIIGWYLIIGMSLTILMLPMYFTNSIFEESLRIMGGNRSLIVANGLIGGIAFIIAGAAMLKGRGWGRWIYFIGVPVGTVISIVAMGAKLLPFLLFGLIFYIVIVVLLTRKPVSDYFAAADDPAPVPEPVAEPVLQTPPAPAVRSSGSSVFRKIVSVILLIPGGMFLTIWLMCLLWATRQVGTLIALSVLFGGLSCLSIIPAIFLWGRKRWAVVMGVFLTVVGAWLLMAAMGMFSVSVSGMIAAQSPQLDPEMIKFFWVSGFIFGILSVVIGVMLIFLQREKDKSANVPALEEGRGTSVVDSTPVV